jgi:plasmid maintenance system antidote protein VapI
MKMHNPPHPGEVLRHLCLEPLNLTVTEAGAIARRKSEGAVWHP